MKSLPRHPKPERIHWMGLVFTISKSLIQLLIPLYAVRLGYSALGIGGLAAIPAAAQLLLRLVTGQVSDQYGETLMLRTSGLLYIVGTLGLLVSPQVGLWGLVAAQILLGIGRSIFFTVGKVYATKLPSGPTGGNISRFNGAAQFGELVGMGSAGFLASYLGYQVSFAVALTLSVCYCALAFLMPPVSRPTGGRLQLRRLLEIVPSGLNWRGLSWACCAALVAPVPLALAASFYPLYLARVGYGEKGISLLLMPILVGTIIASLASQRLIDRIANLRWLLLCCIAATGLTLAVLPAMAGSLPLAALLLATGIISGECNLIYQLLVHRNSPPQRRGVAMAYGGFFWSLCLLLFPIGFGLATTWSSLELAFVGSGILFIAIAAILALILWRIGPSQALAQNLQPAGAVQTRPNAP